MNAEAIYKLAAEVDFAELELREACRLMGKLSWRNEDFDEWSLLQDLEQRVKTLDAAIEAAELAALAEDEIQTELDLKFDSRL